ncbi:MAG: DUF5397 family protein [Beijerinckiaceae bacterium]
MFQALLVQRNKPIPAHAELTIEKPIPRVPVGEFKRFGPFGPKYEVGEPVRPLENDDWAVNVVLVITGEVVAYSLSELLADPKAD